MDADAEAFFVETVDLRPSDLNASRSKLDEFLQAARNRGQRVVLVTSGGTTVPLEKKTVRFIDNFSTGTRGALCAEEFLKAGYAVVFLSRRGSNFPFLTSFVDMLHSSPSALLKGTAAFTAPVDLEENLLHVGFTSIFDYLFLLREASQSLRALGAEGAIFLAAAVSDFYVPERDMASDKIQSRAQDGLSIQLRNVPKLLGAIKLWAPEAFVVSFKLETNPNILLAKAAGAIVKYGVDVVCSNVLKTRYDLVTLVWRDGAAHEIKIGIDRISGDEDAPVQVHGVTTRRVEKGPDCAVVDVCLVRAIVETHDARTKVKAATEDRAAEPDAKRLKASPIV